MIDHNFAQISTDEYKRLLKTETIFQIFLTQLKSKIAEGEAKEYMKYVTCDDLKTLIDLTEKMYKADKAQQDALANDGEENA